MAQKVKPIVTYTSAILYFFFICLPIFHSRLQRGKQASILLAEKMLQIIEQETPKKLAAVHYSPPVVPSQTDDKLPEAVPVFKVQQEAEVCQLFAPASG